MKHVWVLIYSCHLFCRSFKHLLSWCLCQHNDLCHCQAHLQDVRSHTVEQSQSQQLVGLLCLAGVLPANGTAPAAEQSHGFLTESCCYGWKVPALFSQCSEMSEPNLRIGGGKGCKVEFFCVNHRLSISHICVGL